MVGSDAYSVRKKRDSVSTRLKLHMRQTITEGIQVSWKESAHRLRTFQVFAGSCGGGKGAFEMSHSFLYFVGRHFWISRPQRISAKANATTDNKTKLFERFQNDPLSHWILVVWLQVSLWFAQEQTLNRGKGERIGAKIGTCRPLNELQLGTTCALAAHKGALLH